MYKYLPGSAASRMSAVLVIAMSSALAACSNGELALDDTYVPATHYERFPIEVTSGPVRMEVSSRHGTLQTSQINAISGFSRSAGSGSSRITILRPSAGGASGKVARQVYQVLVQSGISPGMISQKTYPGRAKGPVQITYIRSVAVTKECGDWSSDMADTSSNEPYANNGCSTQNNIAAMVVNPNDLVVPRQMTPALAATRTPGVTPTMTLPTASSSVTTALP
ncbi:MAG: CpaD family pilus assembly lipoprotein [Aestuariivirga sp.]|nr:CpaD family pilus assembly lipoprotein [Aestuariivirga sp.]